MLFRSTSSLTIATENDIIINGNITTAVDSSGVPTTAATLGLIADNFVRIYHPCSGGTNASDAISNPTIYAAILATNHSFIVDNFNCGAPLGTLSIQGSVEQIYRGTVGTFGSSSTGYLKHYVYDQRLQTDPPPYFISPVDATWHIYRQVVSFGG